MKRILFNTQFGWPFSLVELALARALRARGHEVYSLICGGLPQYCELEAAFQERPTCEHCIHNTAGRAQSLEVPILKMRDFITDDDISAADAVAKYSSITELLVMERHGVPIGKLARLNLYQYTRGMPIGLPGHQEPVFRRVAHSTLLTAIAMERILDRLTPDIAVTCNAKFAQWAPLIYQAQIKKIHYVTWEDFKVTQQYAEVIFAHNHIAHEQRVEDVWERERHKPLTDAQRAHLYDHFKLWATGVNVYNPFHKDVIGEGPDDVRRKLSLSATRPVVSIFPNLNWDSVALDFDEAFPELFRMLEMIVGYCKQFPDIDFVIRAHPAESKFWDLRKITPTPFCDELRRIHSPLPPNLRLVDGGTELSSYALAGLSSAVITHSGTLGIELALRGYRPWVAGRAYYAGKGFTLDLRSPAHLEQLLARKDFDTRLSAEELEIAQRFVYLTRFRRTFVFPFFDEPNDRLAPPDLNVFNPGGHPVIDRLCDRFISGEPFIDIGPPAA